VNEIALVEVDLRSDNTDQGQLGSRVPVHHHCNPLCSAVTSCQLVLSCNSNLFIEPCSEARAVRRTMANKGDLALSRVSDQVQVLSAPRDDFKHSEEDSGGESESEWETEEEEEEDEEGHSSDSGLGSQGSGYCPRLGRECKRASRHLDRGPYDPTPLADFTSVELEVGERCREWVTRITDPASRVVHELQEEYGKVLPDFIEERQATKEQQAGLDDQQVLQLVGERDSKGRPHGEVEIYYTNGDYFWGDCVHGVKEGLASVVLKNGDNLMGRFRNGLLEGFVTETLSFCERDNVSREVFYKQGVRHGFYREFGPGLKPGSRQFWAIGRFEGGRKIGTHWKWNLGNGWLVGPLDDENRSEGERVAYIYPDLKTVIQGSFHQGKLKSGRLSRLIGSECQLGILLPRATNVRAAPTLAYELSNRFRISTRPFLPEPYEQRYVYVADSQTEGAGEGLWVKTDIRAGQIAAVFNGLRQRDLPGVKSGSKTWSDYRISCNKEIDLDIGKKEESLSNYRATLAHKCCHSFKPNSHFAQFWHPMYGLVMSIVATRDLVAGEEIFVSYNYALEKAPEWYQAIWFAHLREDQGLSEQEIYEWCVRYQRRTGMHLDVPDPPSNSARNNPCGACLNHVGCSLPSISCNSCTTWFHLSCTKVSLEVVEKQPATFTWTCPTCQAGS